MVGTGTRLAWGLLALGGVHAARAERVCTTVGINENGFKKDCGAAMSSAPGETRPSGSDSLSANPAALPTSHTPWGVESILSSQPGKLGARYASAGIIRGFKGFGVGFGSDTDGTFYGNRAAAPVSRKFPSIPGFSLGAAIALPFLSPNPNLFVPVVGAARKFSIDSGTQGYATGLTLAGNLASVGFSYQREPADPLIPDQTNWNFFTSVALGPFTVDGSYAILRYVDSDGYGSRYKSYAATASLTLGPLTLMAGHRVVDGDDTPAVHTEMYGAMLRLLSWVRTGYFYGYRARSHSLGVQILLF